MEDKKTFTAFLIITLVLNVVLLILLVRGLVIYINNVQILNKNNLLVIEFNSLITELKYRIDSPKTDLSILNTRFNSNTSVASYIEKLSFKTNEKNVQILKNLIISSSENEIIMDLQLYGSFKNIVTIINEIEKELPLTEIQESKIEISGDESKISMKLRILIDKND